MIVQEISHGQLLLKLSYEAKIQYKEQLLHILK